MDLLQIADVLFCSLDIDCFCLLFQTHNRQLNKTMVQLSDSVFNTKIIEVLKQLQYRKDYLKFYTVDINGRRMNTEHLFKFYKNPDWNNFCLYSAWDQFTDEDAKLRYINE